MKKITLMISGRVWGKGKKNKCRLVGIQYSFIYKMSMTVVQFYYLIMTGLLTNRYLTYLSYLMTLRRPT
jgi:hypothetical protein